MDPETAKALAPVLAAIVGGLVGWLAARENQQGQRAVARDNARRQDLKELLPPLRTRVADRSAQMLLARDAAQFLWTVDGETDPALIEAAERAVAAVQDRSEVHKGDWSASGSVEIAARYEEWRRTEARCYWNLQAITKEAWSPETSGYVSEALWADFRAATVTLTGAINRTIHGDALVRPEPTSRGVLRWFVGSGRSDR